MENRRGGMTAEEIKLLAVEIVSLQEGACRLTEEQQLAVIDLITQKKKVVRVTLYIVGAMLLWVLKDVYLYIVSHISFGWGR